MFEVIREGIKETSTKEVKSLPRLRSSYTYTYKIKIKDLDFIGARSVDALSLAVFIPKYFGDFAKIIRNKHKAEVKKVVNNAFPFLCR